jgi:hypothetical protein
METNKDSALSCRVLYTGDNQLIAVARYGCDLARRAIAAGELSAPDGRELVTEILERVRVLQEPEEGLPS